MLRSKDPRRLKKLEALKQTPQKQGLQQQTTSLTGSLSKATLKSFSREEEIVSTEMTAQQKLNNKKAAARFFRSTVIQNMRRNFRKMLERTVIKKSAYKLLTSKRKRDVQIGFLAIFGMTINRRRSILQNFNKKLPQLKILERVVRKIDKKYVSVAFNDMKERDQRLRTLCLLAKLVFEAVDRNVIRPTYYEFFNLLKISSVKDYERQVACSNIQKIDQTITINVVRDAFHTVANHKILGQCNALSETKKEKQGDLVNFISNRKQTLVQLREQLKTMKANIDLQKNAKNKVFQDKKKYNNSNKLILEANERKFQKQRKVQEAITDEIQQQLDDQERIVSVRSTIRAKAQYAMGKCEQLYNLFNQEGDVIKNIVRHMPSLPKELVEFKESGTCLFKENLKMQKVIQIHEKRDTYNYEAEYYELEYESNVIRETIRCFMNARYASLPTYHPKKDQNNNIQDSKSENNEKI